MSTLPLDAVPTPAKNPTHPLPARSTLRAAMDAGKSTYDPVLTNYKSKYAVDWAPFLGRKWTDAADTAVPLAELKRLSTRITTRDEVFQGVAVPAGSVLHMRFAAANVDPDEFACPYDMDLDREGITRHVTFSTGPRVCPGATLSRTEQQIAWGALLDRIESIEYGDDNNWVHQPGIMLGTLKLNLRFRKAAEPLSLGTGRASHSV